MCQERTKKTIINAFIKIGGLVVVLLSLFSLSYVIGTTTKNDGKYEHMEYNKINSIDYSFVHKVDEDNKEYWIIGCVYKLESLHIERKVYHTDIKVWIDYKFLTKKEATDSLYCAGEDEDYFNKKVSLYFPTNGYTFNITLPKRHNNKCHYLEFSDVDKKTLLDTGIVFNPYIVYGVNSTDYYHFYLDKRSKNEYMLIGLFFLSLVCLFLGMFFVTEVSAF
jgi:hypothetical protein